MAIELPGPVADLLGFIGISWPNVNEDKVRQFGQHVGEFGESLQKTHADASGSVTALGEAYQGAGYEQLLATWGEKSESQMSQLVTGCEVVSQAMDIAADVIVGMKVEAIAELVALAAQFIAAQAAAAMTFGIAEASVLLIEQEGRQLVRFLEQQLVQYVEGQVLEAAVGPLIDKVAQAISGLVYTGAAAGLGVPCGAGASVTISPSAVRAHAQQLQQHPLTVSGHGQSFASAAAGVSFE